MLNYTVRYSAMKYTYDVFSVSNYSVVHYNYYNTFTYSYFLLLSFFELNNLVYTVVASYLTYIQYFNYTNMYHIGYGLTIINQLILWKDNLQ